MIAEKRILDQSPSNTNSLTILSKQLELSNLSMLEQISNQDTFVTHIKELNTKAILYIQEQDYNQAEVYLQECEKRLEYAVSCGKSIDRALIVVILNNLACVNQRLADFEKCGNYLDAIIYNMGFSFEFRPQRIKKQLESYGRYIHNKILFGLYHLQFCAINSKVSLHSISLTSAKLAIHIIITICQDLLWVASQLPSQDVEKQSIDLLKQLVTCKTNFAVNEYQKNVTIMKDLLSQKPKHESTTSQLPSITHFSTAQLMHLSPITLDNLQCKSSLKDMLKLDKTMLMALYLPIAYFSVATQIRLISSLNDKDQTGVYKLCEDFLLSEVYHISAIILVRRFLPFPSVFWIQLINSYKTNYDMDLEKIMIENGHTYEEIHCHDLNRSNDMPQAYKNRNSTRTSEHNNRNSSEKSKSLRKSEREESLVGKSNYIDDVSSKKKKKNKQSPDCLLGTHKWNMAPKIKSPIKFTTQIIKSHENINKGSSHQFVIPKNTIGSLQLYHKDRIRKQEQKHSIYTKKQSKNFSPQQFNTLQVSIQISKAKSKSKHKKSPYFNKQMLAKHIDSENRKMRKSMRKLDDRKSRGKLKQKQKSKSQEKIKEKSKDKEKEKSKEKSKEKLKDKQMEKIVSVKDLHTSSKKLTIKMNRVVGNKA